MKKGILIMALLILMLISVSCIYAADVNDTLAAGEDTAVIEDAQSEDISVSDDSQVIGQSNDDETVNDGTGSEILGAGEGNYTDLRTDIENGGNLTKSYYRYCDGDGGTIEITTPNMVINGKGAIIDMLGSNIQAFRVNASGVTIKNLTIKRCNLKHDKKDFNIFFRDKYDKFEFINSKEGSKTINNDKRPLSNNQKIEIMDKFQNTTKFEKFNKSDNKFTNNCPLDYFNREFNNRKNNNNNDIIDLI